MHNIVVVSFCVEGTEAIEKLLRKTKLLYSNGYDQVLVKAGGYKQALSDFKSIDPDVMTETKVMLFEPPN